MSIITLESSGKIISELDHSKIHRYIMNAITIEFSNMAQSCYYPKVSKNSKIYKDLLYMTKSKESDLMKYSKEKYRGAKAKFKILHDPYTTLLVLIVQDFLKNKDEAGAEATFHLFSLRYYTNSLYKMTTPKGSHQKICNPDYFQSALDRLSANHMFVKRRTIPNSIMHYSRAVLKRYKQALLDDDSDQIAKMIQELKSRIMQSMRSFFEKYYRARDEKNMIAKSKEERDWDQSHEKKLRNFINRIVNDMCTYGKVDHKAAREASRLIKFNQKLSVKYSETLSNPFFSDKINTALYLLLKDVTDLSVISNTKFLDYIQKLLSIKVTKQEVYFKKIINDIHIQIIDKLDLHDWYDGLSIQSKAISRNFIAYYLGFYIRSYIAHT